MTHSFALRACIAFLPLAATLFAAEQPSSDARFLDGLRKRQLFRLAESYCADALDNKQLPAGRRADLIVQLSQTYVEHARQSSPGESAPLWRQAEQAAASHAAPLGNSSWRLVVDVQTAMTALARGELARQRAELAGNDAALLAEARGALRSAIRSFETQLQRIAETLRTHRNVDGEMSRGQLLALDKNTQFALARAYRNQALCYPADSPDRANGLNEALNILRRLSRLSTVDSLAWWSRLEEVHCYRLSGQLPLALQKLAALEKAEPPPDVLLQTRAERVRTFIALNRLADAQREVEKGRRIDGHVSANLDFAHLELALAVWQAAVKSKNKPSATQWQEKAIRVAKGIELAHPPYWSRRAESKLAGVMSNVGLDGNLASLVRAAQGFYRGQQPDKAIAAYDQASQMALTQKNPAQAFELAHTAAAIEQQRKNHAAAAERFRRLALSQSEHPSSGETHLLAIRNAAQAAQQTSPIDLSGYEQLIVEHIKTWPRANSTNEARWYLGRLREYEKQWGEAITAYRAIEAGHERFFAAVEAAARCYESYLSSLQSAGKSTLEPAKSAAAYFERLVLKPGWPERWSPHQRLAVLTAAKIRLSHTPGEYRRVEQLLGAALGGQPPPPDEFRSAATSLLIAALAGQGQYAKAAALVNQTAGASFTEQLALLRRLTAVGEKVPAEARKPLGVLQLRAADNVWRQRDKLDENGRKTLNLIRAQAAAASGDARTAAALYQKLAADHPRDAEIQESYARQLFQAGDRRSLETALTKWREIERRTKPATPRWFRAKYHIAATYHRLGNSARAVKIIQVTRVLHPDLGGEELKAKFQSLWEKCKNK